MLTRRILQNENFSYYKTEKKTLKYNNSYEFKANDTPSAN